MAVASLQQYAGGTFVAAGIAGLVNGYNGNYSGGMFGGDATLGTCEKAGMMLGTILALNPGKLGARTVAKVASSELAGVAVNKAVQKGASCINFFAKNTAIQSTKKVATTAVEKSTEIAERKALTKIGSLKTTSYGITHTGFTKHGVDRVIERAVKPKSIQDAIKHPLEIQPIKFDMLERASQRIIGREAEVVLNPISGKILSANPTSTKKMMKLLRSVEQ